MVRTWKSHPWPPRSRPEHFIIAWDGNWYNSIIQHGYQSGVITTQANVAFFPLYPILVGLASHFLPTYVGALLLSTGCFLGALLLLYKLVREKYDKNTARWALLLAAFNPWSFYFAMMYTESLFFLLAVATFYLLYHRRFWWAAIIAGLAAATRSPGIILTLIVVVSWIVAHKSQLQNPRIYLRAILLCCIGGSGLLAFMTFLYFNNHDPLAFVHVQRYWPGRSGGLFSEISLLVQHLHKMNLQYLIVAMWYGVTILGLIGTAIWIKRREYSYATLTGLGILLPLSTGSATSMNRYGIVLFPLYILGALFISRRPLPIKLLLSSICLIALAGMMYLITRLDQPFLG